MADTIKLSGPNKHPFVAGSEVTPFRNVCSGKTYTDFENFAIRPDIRKVFAHNLMQSSGISDGPHRVKLCIEREYPNTVSQ